MFHHQHPIRLYNALRVPGYGNRPFMSLHHQARRFLVCIAMVWQSTAGTERRFSWFTSWHENHRNNYSPIPIKRPFKMKRFLMISVWTVGVYFGSELILAPLIGFLLGAVSVICYHFHYNLHEYLDTHHFSPILFGIVFRIICALLAVTAFILALRGHLPGTKIRHDLSAKN